MSAFKPTAILALLVLFSLQACSSQPDIPDEEKQPISYGSLSEDEEKSAFKDPKSTQEVSESYEAGTGVLVATGPVAMVGAKPITAKEFNSEVEKLTATNLPASVMSKIKGARRDQLKKKLVENMVNRKLVESELEKTPVEVTDAQVDQRIKEMREELEFAKGQGQGKFNSLEQMMKSMGLSPDELRDSIKRSIALETLVQKKHPYETATQEDAKALYEKNQEYFKRPERVHARHILIKVPKDSDPTAWEKTKAKMLEIRAAVVTTKQKTFEQAAKEFSEDGSAANGGSLGFFPKKVMVPEFEKVAFELKPGQVSDPVRTQFGWHLIKVEAHQEAGITPFEALSDQLTRQITTRRFQQAFAKYVSQIQSDTKIEFKLENIK